MFDKDMVYRDEFMGEVHVKLADFCDGEVHDKWFPLQNEPAAKKIDKAQGEIHLKLHFKSDHARPKSAKASTSAEVAKPTPGAKQPEVAKTIEEKYDLGKVIGRSARLFGIFVHLLQRCLFRGKSWN
jgi:hypothetical protein